MNKKPVTCCNPPEILPELVRTAFKCIFIGIFCIIGQKIRRVPKGEGNQKLKILGQKLSSISYGAKYYPIGKTLDPPP